MLAPFSRSTRPSTLVIRRVYAPSIRHTSHSTILHPTRSTHHTTDEPPWIIAGKEMRRYASHGAASPHPASGPLSAASTGPGLQAVDTLDQGAVHHVQRPSSGPVQCPPSGPVQCPPSGPVQCPPATTCPTCPTCPTGLDSAPRGAVVSATPVSTTPTKASRARRARIVVRVRVSRRLVIPIIVLPSLPFLCSALRLVHALPHRGRRVAIRQDYKAGRAETRIPYSCRPMRGGPGGGAQSGYRCRRDSPDSTTLARSSHGRGSRSVLE